MEFRVCSKRGYTQGLEAEAREQYRVGFVEQFFLSRDQVGPVRQDLYSRAIYLGKNKNFFHPEEGIRRFSPYLSEAFLFGGCFVTLSEFEGFPGFLGELVGLPNRVLSICSEDPWIIPLTATELGVSQ